MAYAATKEVLQSWDLVMTEAQEKRFREAHFEPTWSKYAKLGFFTGNDHLSNQYATSFVNDIAQLTKADKRRIKGGKEEEPEISVEVS